MDDIARLRDLLRRSYELFELGEELGAALGHSTPSLETKRQRADEIRLILMEELEPTRVAKVRAVMAENDLDPRNLRMLLSLL